MIKQPSDRLITYKERLRLAMIACLAALIMLICSACVFQRPVTRIESSQSVYKIAVDVTEGAPVADDQDDESISDEETHEKWTGTAWVAQRVDGRSYVLTAGHVCETRDSVPEEGLLGPTGRQLPVRNVSYQLLAPDGTVFTGAVVMLDDDDLDLCALAVPGDLGPAIPIADSEPHYGDHGWYIGAPRGVWGGGIAGIYEVTFMGRGALFRGGCSTIAKACDADSLAFSSAEAAPGASGSPIIVGGNAVALLNLSASRFQTVTTGVPWDKLRAFMTRVRHDLQ